ncbi:Tc toxin subunit A [Rahnella aquatilis]|uniref:Tc toxin subunit A n=1 Tax=Rahnella aquatilis TaxID=34038 RepID=UPI00365A5C31
MSGNNPDSLSRISAVLQLNDQLEEQGYHSVFDIVRVPRNTFINRHQQDFGQDTQKVYDLAVGYATQLSRLFKKNALAGATVAATSPALLRGVQNSQDLQATQLGALEQNIPTYASLFNETWTQYCLTSAPEALDSPVSYLSFLYQQALDWENAAGSAVNSVFHLSQRRPDLPGLLLDDDAINQVIPTLDIVNDVLEAAIAPSVPESTTVDKTLSTTRYPNTLPYHYPHQQVLTALEDKPVVLQDIIQQADVTWPLFTGDTFSSVLADTAKKLGSNLAPEQQHIVAEAVNASTDAWYQANYGVASAASAVTELGDREVFLQKTSLDETQLESLIAGNAGGSTVVASVNVPDLTTSPTQYGAKFINAGQGKPVTIDTPRENIIINPVQDQSGTANLIINGSPASTSDAPFGEGIILNAVKGEYFYAPVEIGCPDNILTDFTLGFWCKVPTDVNDLAMVFTNKTDHYASSAAGVSLFVHTAGGQYYLRGNISDGTPAGELYYDFPFTEAGKWSYFVFQQNAKNKIISVLFSRDEKIYSKNDCSFSHLENNTRGTNSLGFNGNKPDNAYYNSHTGRKSTLEYDDICIWDKILSYDDIEKIIESGLPAGGRNDMSHYYPLDSTIPPGIVNLNHDRLERINRQTRLQRWLGLPYDQVDLLVSAAQHAENNTTLTMNDNTLRMLGVFRHYQQYYAVNAWQFAALIDEITPYAISPAVPFFDQIFNSPSLFEKPFALTNTDFIYDDNSSQNGRIIKQLCAGLGITEAQFSVLAERVAGQQGNLVNKTLPCSLSVVSALYRLATLPKLFGLSLTEGLSLMQLISGQRVVDKLAGVPVIKAVNASGDDILDVLMALSAGVQWLKTTGLSAATSLVILDTEGARQPQENATTGQMNLISDINQHLSSALLTDAVFEANGIRGELFSITETMTDGSTFIYMNEEQSKFTPSYGITTHEEKYICFSDSVMSILQGMNDYTIGFWITVPLATNTSSDKLMTNMTSGEKAGFFIELLNNQFSNLQVRYSDDAGHEHYAAVTGCPSDEWFYLSFSFNAETTQLQLYCSFDDALIDSYGDKLAGELIVPGNHVVIGRYGNLEPYVKDSNRLFGYCDIAVWKRILTLDEIRSNVLKNSPVMNYDYKIYPNEYSTYLNILDDIIDTSGIILPVICQQGESELDAITRMVAADIAKVEIDSLLTDEQITAQLANLIYQTKLTQDGIANSAIARTLGVDQSLSPFLLTWADSGSYDLLSKTWALRDVTDAHDRAVNLWSELLFDVGRRAALTRIFQLSAAAVSTYLSHPDWFGVPDTTLTLPLLYTFSRYDCLSLQTPLNEDDILAYLSWANSGNAIVPAESSRALAALLDWELKETEIAIYYVCDIAPVKWVINLSQIEQVMRLQHLSQLTGLSMTPLLEIIQLTTQSDYDQWQQAGESLISTTQAE